MKIKYERDGDVATFTFAHGKLNVLTPEIHRDFFRLLQEFEADETIKVGVLSGAGETFSAGDDIKSPRPHLEGEALLLRHFFPRSGGVDLLGYPGWERDIMRMERFKPIVGAVRGWCLGQGFLYLLHLTDIRIAGESARFGFPEINYGMGGAGAMARILRHLPRTVAARLLLTGDPIDARGAERTFLVNEVAPDDEVLSRALDVAKRIARHPALSIRVEMEGLIRSADLDSQSSVAFADHLYRLQRLALKRDGEEVPKFAYKAGPEL